MERTEYSQLKRASDGPSSDEGGGGMEGEVEGLGFQSNIQGSHGCCALSALLCFREFAELALAS
jgi:hypothetical protein